MYIYIYRFFTSIYICIHMSMCNTEKHRCLIESGFGCRRPRNSASLSCNVGTTARSGLSQNWKLGDLVSWPSNRPCGAF